MYFHLWFVRAYGSESEADEEAATVTLSSDIGRVNRASNKSAVKLQEVGPRMTLQLVRVEKGLCSGDVLFSEFGTQSYSFPSSKFTYFSWEIYDPTIIFCCLEVINVCKSSFEPFLTGTFYIRDGPVVIFMHSIVNISFLQEFFFMLSIIILSYVLNIFHILNLRHPIHPYVLSLDLFSWC